MNCGIMARFASTALAEDPARNPATVAGFLEQLREARIEPAVTTDVAGKDHAHALRLADWRASVSATSVDELSEGPPSSGEVPGAYRSTP